MSSACVELLLQRAATLGLALLLCACSGGQDAPQDRIRASIGALQQAVQDGSLKQAAGYLHPNYQDERHANKAAALRSLFAYLRRHDAIHLFVRITSIEVAPQQQTAQAVAYVAMAGVPVASVETLVSVEADLYRFELQLEEYDGSWIVRRADWRRADVRALLPH
ncbi:MAG: hypothetical protein R3E46_15995 [Sedimenticolaceae bacterium]